MCSHVRVDQRGSAVLQADVNLEHRNPPHSVVNYRGNFRLTNCLLLLGSLFEISSVVTSALFVLLEFVIIFNFEDLELCF